MKKWTEAEERMMRELYPDMHTNELAVMLNKSVFSVGQKAYKMGLKKSKAFSEMLIKKFAEGNVATRFRKGQEPKNKGVKLSPEEKAKFQATWFKKGNVPHNTKWDGHERVNIDGYIEVRVSKGKYVLKHRLVWEKNSGTVPKGMVVVFKDRNPMNCDFGNLELISMKENMLRNTIHRYPKEVKSAIRLLGKLRKKIKSKQNESEK